MSVDDVSPCMHHTYFHYSDKFCDSATDHEIIASYPAGLEGEAIMIVISLVESQKLIILDMGLVKLHAKRMVDNSRSAIKTLSCIVK